MLTGGGADPPADIVGFQAKFVYGLEVSDLKIFV